MDHVETSSQSCLKDHVDTSSQSCLKTDYHKPVSQVYWMTGRVIFNTGYVHNHHQQLREITNWSFVAVELTQIDWQRHLVNHVCSQLFKATPSKHFNIPDRLVGSPAVQSCTCLFCVHMLSGYQMCPTLLDVYSRDVNVMVGRVDNVSRCICRL